MKPNRFTQRMVGTVLRGGRMAGLAWCSAALLLEPHGVRAQVPSTPPGQPGATPTEPAPLPPNEPIQVSFQGANVDMVVQWLSQSTGKSVVKHPQVQCQLTISSTRKLPLREAIELVYRALSLEGFTAVESNNSIFIVPEGKEPKMSPELLDSTREEVPAGRQKLMKIFQLKSVSANEMKAKIKALLSDKAVIDVNDRGNQLIITDYTDTINLAAQFIRALDTDAPGDLSVRIIALKHVSAQDLVKEITPLYQKISGKSANEPVEVSANDRSNSLIVFSSESNYKALQRIVETLDSEDAQERTLRPFPLKNADAEDVAKQLKDLNEDSSGNRYRYFYFDSGPDPKGRKKMTVVADRRRNTVLVQAPPAEMDGIAKMIAALDEPVRGDSLAPRIYPMKYVSAVDIEDVLNELFLKKNQQRPYYFFDDAPQETPERNVGRLYGKVRITSEPYSNAIIITANSTESLAAIEDVLKQLDVPSSAGESTLRVNLKFAKASTVANSLNILFAKGGSPALRPVAPPNPQNPNPQNPEQQPFDSNQNTTGLEKDTKEEVYFPWLGGQPETTRGGDTKSVGRQVSDLVGRIRVVPDHRSNSLLIAANVHFFPQVIKLIEDLDAPTAQVLIEARILEVSSDFMDRLGVRWSPDGSKTFTAEDLDGSIIGSTKGNFTKGFGGNTAASLPAPPAASLASSIANLRSGVIDSTVSMDLLVQFLRRTTAASVLAEPQINIEDNESGKLFVGSQVPFINQSQNTQVGSLNQSFKYKDVGIILEVIPHININGDVSLKIRVESSAIQPGQTLFGGAILDTRTFKTDMTAKNGQTLVLGGILQKQVSDTVRKVPVLGSIPGLGWAFKKKDKTTREVELLVFLRPRVIRSAEDALKAAEEVSARAPLIRSRAQDFERFSPTNGVAKPVQNE